MGSKLIEKFFLAVITICLVCCDTAISESTSLTYSEGQAKKVRFEYSVRPSPFVAGQVQALCVLINENADTSYFISQSCYGDQFFLKFNSEDYILRPGALCEFVVPVLSIIPPKLKHQFQ